MYTKKKCCCGSESCKDYWLVGIGSFVQGSGFTESEADKILIALNNHKELLEACKEALRWHKGDKWRMSQDEEQVRAWNQTDHKLEQAINKAEGKS